MSKLALLHPDYLVDRARSGELDALARRQLGAHLAACSACTWEQLATDDFARERDAESLDAAMLDRLITGTLSRSGLLDRPRARRAAPQARQAAPVTMARFLTAAAMVAVAIGLALALPSRPPREGAYAGSAAVPTGETSLDAGAVGAACGGDT